MTATFNSATTSTAGAVSWKSTALAAGIGAVGGLVINSVIAWTARGLFDVPAEFQQLTLPVYGMLTVIGAIIGAVGWHLIATRARNATRLLSWLVPTVLVVSLLADLPLLMDKSSMPGTTTAGVLALMLMHFGVAAAAVPAYRKFIPPQS
ncbi:MAG TPA: DUF6069 family protein [Actinoplanes sp.]